MKDIVKRKKSSFGRYIVYFFRHFAKLSWKVDGLFFLVYALLVVAVSWPLVLNLNTQMPGLGNDGGDGFIFLWNLWWVKKQLLSSGDIFFTNYLFYPQGVNLIFHTLIFGEAIIGAIFGRVFSNVFIFNGLFLLFMWMSAVFSYLLTKEFWKSRWAAFWAGIIFAFCPYVMSQARGHFNLTTIWPFPALIWFWLIAVRKNNLVWAIVAGLVLAFICLNDWQYFIFAILLFICSVVYSFIYEKKNSGKKIILVFLTLAVSALIFVPFLLKTFLVASDYLPKALLSEVSYWSADILSWLIPSGLNPFLGEIGRYYGERYYGLGIESQTYLGWLVIIFYLLSWFIKKNEEDKRIFFWQVLVIIFGLLSLGPLLKIAGNTNFSLNDLKFTVALPYMLLYKIPYLDIARVPSRFIILMMLALAVVFAWVVKKITEMIWTSIKLPKIIRGTLMVIFFIGIGSLLFLEYSAWPMSMQRIYVPKIYQEIKKDPEQFTILELPLWWSSGHRATGDQKTIIQYWQTYHGKRILNGSISRVPDALFDYYLTKPGIEYLIDVKNNILEKRDKDILLVEKTWRDELGIKYVVVHKNFFSDDDFYRIRAYLENILGLKVWYEDEEEIGYQLNE